MQRLHGILFQLRACNDARVFAINGGGSGSVFDTAWVHIQGYKCTHYYRAPSSWRYVVPLSVCAVSRITPKAVVVWWNVWRSSSHVWVRLATRITMQILELFKVFFLNCGIWPMLRCTKWSVKQPCRVFTWFYSIALSQVMLEWYRPRHERQLKWRTVLGSHVCRRMTPHYYRCVECWCRCQS